MYVFASEDHNYVRLVFVPNMLPLEVFCLLYLCVFTVESNILHQGSISVQSLPEHSSATIVRNRMLGYIISSKNNYMHNWMSIGTDGNFNRKLVY